MDVNETSRREAKESEVGGGRWGQMKGLGEKCKWKVMEMGSNIKKTAEADPRRVTHSIKVGIALTLVSLLYYARPLYDGFGVAGMWAVLTVVVIFEFTVGATLSKGMNRGFATLVAGALGVGGQHLATLFGERAKPIVLGTLVFILAAGATFSRFFPKIKARYDYGVLIFILTFSLVAVSGQRVDEIFELAHQRLLTILVGGATCIIISLFLFPVWAGQDLHNLVASNLEKLANYLQGFEGEYFQCSSEDKLENPDKSLLQGYKSVLNSKASEESLANFARWEPGHGRFGLRHPWKHYLKVGSLARECAYKIEILNTYLNPEIQVSLELKSKMEESCRKMISESSKALKALSSSLKTMTHPCDAAKGHLQNSKTAIEELKIALEGASLEDQDLLAIVPVVTVASILLQISNSVHKIHDSVSHLSQLAHFNPSNSNTNVVHNLVVSPEKQPHHPPPHLLHRGIINPVVELEINDDDTHTHTHTNNDHIEITIHEPNTDSPEIISTHACTTTTIPNSTVNIISVNC